MSILDDFRSEFKSIDFDNLLQTMKSKIPSTNESLDNINPSKAFGDLVKIIHFLSDKNQLKRLQKKSPLQEPKSKPIRFKNPEDLVSVSILDIDKLPKNVKNDFKKNKRFQFVGQLIEIFKILKRPLHVGEIQIAMYRLHKEDLKRSVLSNRLHRVCEQEKSIQKCKSRKGYYEYLNL